MPHQSQFENPENPGEPQKWPIYVPELLWGWKLVWVQACNEREYAVAQKFCPR